MHWYRPLGQAGLSWRSVTAASGRPSLWQAPLIVAGVRALLLFAVACFALPGVSPIGRFLVELLADESALHFPQLYLILPTMFARADLFLSASIGAIAHAAAVLHFAGAFRRRPPGRVWQQSFRRSPVILSLAVLLLLSEWGLNALDGQFGAKLPALAGAGILVAARIFARALFCYGVIACVAYDASAWRSIRTGTRMLLRNPATSAILVGVPTVLLDVVGNLLAGLDPTRAGLAPEAMLAAMFAQVGFQLLGAFLLIGATTRLFLSQYER